MNAESPTPVRAFISYSWSSPTHESWVLSLATRLREDGVDVILDKWDLKPGHDAYAFMESMVTDRSVTKVLMICDKVYVAKADNRSGGVGTESQIISPELYGAGQQDKYAALMTDQDEHGNAHVPVFYRGRIFFDFRSADQFEESYEQLLRWLVDKPLHVKPKLGSLPKLLLNTQPVASGTQSRLLRAQQALQNGNSQASAYIRDIGDPLLAELKALIPSPQESEPADEMVLLAVASMRPYLHQLTELARSIARFSKDEEVWSRFLAIIEQIGRLMYPSDDLPYRHDWQLDTFRMAVHDAFLSALAITLEEERFDLTGQMLARAYLVREIDGGNRPSTSDFTVFNQSLKSLEYRNNRLKLNRISVHADLVKEAHSAGSLPSFESIMQADFVCFLRSGTLDNLYSWYPLTLVYAANRFAPFSIFARSESLAYLNRMMSLIGVEDLAGLRTLITTMGQRSSRMFNYHGLPIKWLSNYEHLGIRP